MAKRITHQSIADRLGVKRQEVTLWHSKDKVPLDYVAMKRHFDLKRKRGRRLILPATGKFEDTETWEDRVKFAREFEWRQRKALQAANDAGQVGDLVSLMKAHHASQDRLREAERMATEAEIQGGHLISTEAVREMIIEALAPLRQALDKLPVNERTNCNPEKPEVAERALKEWRDRLLLRAQSALAKFWGLENA